MSRLDRIIVVVWTAQKALEKVVEGFIFFGLGNFRRDRREGGLNLWPARRAALAKLGSARLRDRVDVVWHKIEAVHKRRVGLGRRCGGRSAG